MVLVIRQDKALEQLEVVLLSKLMMRLPEAESQSEAPFLAKGSPLAGCRTGET